MASLEYLTVPNSSRESTIFAVRVGKEAVAILIPCDSSLAVPDAATDGHETPQTRQHDTKLVRHLSNVVPLSAPTLLRSACTNREQQSLLHVSLSEETATVVELHEALEERDLAALSKALSIPDFIFIVL